jgi:asparagine synthase (glutamine-hydrolysing)
MRHYAWLRAGVVPDLGPGLAVGIVAHDHRRDEAVAVSADGRVVVVLDGEFLEGGRAVHAPGFLARWQREGASFLGSLNGEFAAVVWDSARRELHVVTDRFGLRCLYLAQTPEAFAVASEIKAVLAAPGVDTSWSEAGVAQFFSFGHFYGDDTLLRGVRAVPAATCGTYRVDDRRYTENRYWDLRSGTVLGSPAELTRELDERFAAAVARRANTGEHLGLSLSGGLDARTILGVMPRGVDLKTVSLGIDGSLDHRSASELAAIAGVPHRQYVLNGSFLSSFEQHLREMIRLTDGHYLDQGIVMPSMPVYRELGIDYLMRGHGGELMHMRKAYAFSLDDEALRVSEAELEAWLFAHLTGYMLAGVPDDLFTIDLRALARESLTRALSRCQAADQPVDRVWSLFLNERIHRETALSMHKFGCFATVRQPYLDPDVIELLFSLPAGLKLGDELQTAILARRQPEFLRVTNANTGARMGAGSLETAIATFRMRVAAKLGVKGYQPYERLGLWLRRELRSLVEATLSSETILGSGLVRPLTVQRLVHEHLAAEQNHTFLLMALLILTLCQREQATGVAA